MRVSRIQAAENRERILDVATRLFRERGIDGIGVDDLMKAAGLTHGGFYGHFKSKEDLVAQACARAVTRMRQNWTNVVDQSTGDPLNALAATYLTPKHRDSAGRGCPMAALGSEIARQGHTVRRAFTDELRPFFDYLSTIVQGTSSNRRRQKALATFASLVGALIISRAVDDPNLSDEILAAVANSMRDKDVERDRLKTSSAPRRISAKKSPSVKHSSSSPRTRRIVSAK
jgi:TetR/AcrR family transcriptional regulator, transcriptional repressor for nem operon